MNRPGPPPACAGDRSALVPAAAGSAGCSNQQIYDTIQQANLQAYQNNPEFTREKCERPMKETIT
jgi:hypothetical protein